MRRLYTIGYQGASESGFLDTLRRAGVDLLLDVRERPFSRRTEFSRDALRALLEGAGIGYRHEVRLGAPEPVRRRVREDGDYGEFFRAYDNYLEAQSGLLSRLSEELEGGVALMCYERDVRVCHRLSVARELSRLTGLEPGHLVPGDEPDDGPTGDLFG